MKFRCGAGANRAPLGEVLRKRAARRPFFASLRKVPRKLMAAVRVKERMNPVAESAAGA
jgi:hypothetical protein